MNNLYDLALNILKAQNENTSIMKAATDYTVSGSLERTNALNLYDTVRKQGDLVSRIRRVNSASLKYDLNQFANTGVITGRADAVTAKAAIIAGNDVADINKKNIGNTGTLKELYHLFSRSGEEVTDLVQYGEAEFNSNLSMQLAEDWSDKLENLVLNGDNTANQPTGILKHCKDNLAANSTEEATGKKVRNIDINAAGSEITTIKGRLDALIKKQQVKYRKESVILISENDYQTLIDELVATESLSTGRDILRDQTLPYRGYELIRLPYMPDNNYIMSPLNNIAFVVSAKDTRRNTEVQEVPFNILYSIMGFWNFDFCTYDKVTIAYDKTPIV